MSPTLRPDATLRDAVDLAREAARSIADGDTVGEHLGMEMVEERLATHWFACTAPAYRGWRWSVSVARVPRSKVVTVCETGLEPGPDALRSPEWVPYASRLAPGDLGPGDVTPLVADDPLLEAGFEATGDDDVDAVALWELGLGRPRVLSPEGREVAATRWYEGDHGRRPPSRRRRRLRARRAGTSSPWPARCARCSGCAPTSGLPVTGGW